MREKPTFLMARTSLVTGDTCTCMYMYMYVWELEPSKIFNPPFPVLKAGHSVSYSYICNVCREWVIGVGFFLFYLNFPVWLVCYAHDFHVHMYMYMYIVPLNHRSVLSPQYSWTTENQWRHGGPRGGHGGYGGPARGSSGTGWSCNSGLFINMTITSH